jgi:hypothetical protein
MAMSIDEAWGCCTSRAKENSGEGDQKSAFASRNFAELSAIEKTWSKCEREEV